MSLNLERKPRVPKSVEVCMLKPPVKQMNGTVINIIVFPILVSDLAELDALCSFLKLHTDSGVDYVWIIEMITCIIHGSVHYSGIGKI